MLTLDTAAYQVSQTANVIAATSVTASDCSSTYRQTSQLSQLTTLTVSVTTYTETVSSTLTAVQTLLVTATGTSVSASDVPTATTVSTRLRDKRKYQNFHAMANLPLRNPVIGTMYKKRFYKEKVAIKLLALSKEYARILVYDLEIILLPGMEVEAHFFLGNS